MSARILKKKTSAEKKVENNTVEVEVDEEAEKLKRLSDEIIDEIDGLLEENAEDFVKAFVQKGGE